MKLVKISLAAALACAAAVSVYAEDVKPKVELKNNMMEVYNVLPGTANSIGEAFTNGVFYGRLRANFFMWDWKAEDTWNPATGKGNMDNKAHGLGGSLLYKTAKYEGFSATAALYYSGSPIAGLREDKADLGGVKAGKDTVNRNGVRATGDWQMASLAQAYLQYDVSKTNFKLGRQIFESFLTASNDTKMIPNTFMGFVAETKEVPQTTLRAAYFTSQKLRDHTEFHDVITSTDEAGNSWNGNDDSAKHAGLTYNNLKAAGEDTENALVIVDMRNKSIDNLQIDVTYGAVPGLISSLTGELNYAIPMGGMTLTPGVRYMMQMDNGAGDVGGATLKGGLAASKGALATNLGYKDRYDLDSSLSAARLVLTDGIFKAQVGYSMIEDAGDIVAPWRGFPTGGYTRAMAQYNWYANTKTTAAEVFYDFGKAKMVDGLGVLVRYAMQDFDEDKQAAGVQADSNVLHIDIRERFTKTLDAKIRLGFVDADKRLNGKDQDSYNEYRFEVNYLF